MYEEDQLAIMTKYGIWGKGMSHKGCIGKCKRWNLLLSIRHISWVEFYICSLCFCKVNFFGILLIHNVSYLLVKNLQCIVHMRIVGVQSVEMVGEWCRKQPMGEVEKWRSRGKVWDKLEQGGISRWITKLHGFDQEVTNNMVSSWKDSRVKVNGVSFLIIEEVVLTVTEIPVEGFKFFRDKELSSNVVKDFVKNTKKLNVLKKSETFYEMEFIKKLWRHVLHTVIE